MTRYHIGIDDTDNLETRGTGFRARQLVERLQDRNIAQGVAVTRHQLLVDPLIPYTSHNSSACVVVASEAPRETLAASCREFLLEIAAAGSDVGLCVADFAQAHAVAEFGRRAKIEVLDQNQANTAAGANGMLLEGLTGTRGGVIGALAAVGLHADGNDGRYLWLAGGLRDHTGEVATLEIVLTRYGVERVATIDGATLRDPAVEIDLGSWPRPVRIDGQAVLLVEKCHGTHRYQVATKDLLKSIRP